MLNNLVDNATFAADAVDNSTIILSGGKLAINTDGLSASNIATDAVTPDAVDRDGGEYFLDDVTAKTTKLTPYSANVSGAVTIDLDNGNFQILTLDDNITAIAGMSNQEAGKAFTILFKPVGDDFTIATGSWASTWIWMGGDEPSGSATDGTIDIVSGVTDGSFCYVTMLKGFA